ncbi:MAG: tRNA (adenosine(37)-N6)-threonylcarbamoyltransferase complex ATPase subunit type 1 TsaE [Deltaproteobacteria bacterium]|nr:tRNA (adenosine(37)-N6)-threonylcarbamoyltransferase complex ATPase subunit type 1 TsaE [Deltaproteobacteria bacterium]
MSLADCYEFISKSPEDTLNFGVRLGAHLRGGEIILLSGDLGAGKTLFTKGIASALEVDNMTPVISPSFTLVNIYKARLDIVHVDLYRLGPDDVWDLGLEDFMDKHHIIIVEWGNIARAFFNMPVIDVKIIYVEDQTRKILIKGMKLICMS